MTTRDPATSDGAGRADPSPPGLAARRRVVTALTLALFFGSGAVALVYELCWLRVITLHLGSTAIAVSLVLALFMGGLALGATLGGRIADRGVRALRLYAWIELAVSAYAFLSSRFFAAATAAVAGWLGAEGAERFVLLTTVRFLVIAALLLPPTVLMGATLPLLSRFLADRGSPGGRAAGLLYGCNTIGAFVGTVLAGFVLLPRFGLVATLAGAAAVNAAVALLALGLSLRLEAVRTAAGRDPGLGVRPSSPATAAGDPADGASPGLLVAVAASGLAFMACEVAWARVLAQVLGGSAYALTIVLATVLLGLGGGAAIVAVALRASPRAARRLFFGLALASGVAVCSSSAMFSRLPYWFIRLFAAWRLDQEFDRVLQVEWLLAGAVILLPATLMGGLFPAAAQLAIRSAAHTGRGAGRVYAWTTVGDIAGSLGAGLVLIPTLGIRATLLVAVGLLTLAAAAAVVSWARPRSSLAAGLASATVLALAIGLTPRWDEVTMSIGPYQYAAKWADALERDPSREIMRSLVKLYYEDGLTSTVAVFKSPTDAYRQLQINGKVDGSDGGDMLTQRMLAHVPLLLHPRPRSALVVGLGTGCTAGSAAIHGAVEQVTAVEIERAVIDASRRLFSHVNHRVHENPRARVVATDARFFLRTHPGAFDVIIATPSNPWQAGNADLFTEDYYRLGAAALTAGGVFGQWMHLYTMSPENLALLVRTFLRVFPQAYVVHVPPNDLMVIGSRGELPLDPVRLRRRFEADGVAEDLRLPTHPNVDSFEGLLALFRLGPAGARSLASGGDGRLHTDDLPVVAYEGPKDVLRTTVSANLQLIARHAEGCAPYLEWPEGTAREERTELLRALAAKYRGLYGPGSREAAACEAEIGEPARPVSSRP